MTARIARPISSRLGGSSALRRERPAVSAQASVSSPSPSAVGRATLRCSASSGRSPWIDSMTAGHSSANPSRSRPTAATIGSAPGASGSITATAATAGSARRAGSGAAAAGGRGRVSVARPRAARRARRSRLGGGPERARSAERLGGRLGPAERLGGRAAAGAARRGARSPAARGRGGCGGAARGGGGHGRRAARGRRGGAAGLEPLERATAAPWRRRRPSGRRP